MVVVNAAQVDVSGKKLEQKRYYRHTGYPGHLREVPLERMMERHPGRVIEKAVKGMLPRNRLGRRMLGRLKVYSGPTHPHQAQVNPGMGMPKEPRPVRKKAPTAAQKAEAKASKKQAASATVQPKAAQAAAKKPAATKTAATKPKAAGTPKRQPRAAKTPAAPDLVEESAPQEEKEK